MDTNSLIYLFFIYLFFLGGGKEVGWSPQVVNLSCFIKTIHTCTYNDSVLKQVFWVTKNNPLYNTAVIGNLTIIKTLTHSHLSQVRGSCTGWKNRQTGKTALFITMFSWVNVNEDVRQNKLSGCEWPWCYSQFFIETLNSELIFCSKNSNCKLLTFLH